VSEILIVDDDRDFSETVTRLLERRGHGVRRASSGAAGLALVADRLPRLILLDLHLPDMSGLDAIDRFRAAVPDGQIVIVTGFPNLSSAVHALRGRVTDYLCKPDAFDDLDRVLRQVFGDSPPTAPGAPSAGRPRPGSAEMVAVAPASRAVRDLIQRLAASGVRAALVTGESGTGKELAARLLHRDGPRRDGPFVDVNCSAVSEALFESEFFGHERGAFTGAVQARRGLVELAHGGTLFLDEVAEMSPTSQAKLLRFLDDQSFLRIGGGRKMQVDVHIVAATNSSSR
jgi:two-component system response regulator AtoC